MTYTKRRYNRKKSIKRKKIKRKNKKRTKMKGGSAGTFSELVDFHALQSGSAISINGLINICDKKPTLLTDTNIENIKLQPITTEQIAQIEKIVDDLKKKEAPTPKVEENTKKSQNIRGISSPKGLSFADIVTTKGMAGKLIKRIREKILSLINKKCNIKILQIIFNNYNIDINLDKDKLIDETGPQITLGDKIFSNFEQTTNSEIIESIEIGLNEIKKNHLNGGGKITKKRKKKLKGGDIIIAFVFAAIFAVIGLYMAAKSAYSYIHRMKLEEDNVENLKKLTKIKDFIVVQKATYNGYLASIKIFIPYWYQRNNIVYDPNIFLQQNDTGSFVIYKKGLSTYLKYVTINGQTAKLKIDDIEDKLTFNGETFKTYPDLINYYKINEIDGTILIEKNSDFYSLNVEEVQIKQGVFLISVKKRVPLFTHTDTDITESFKEINENNKYYRKADDIKLDVGEKIEGRVLRDKIGEIKNIVLKHFKLI